MRHKFQEPVQHEHNVEFDAEDVKDVLDKVQEVALTVIATYLVGDTIRHILKKGVK